MKISVLTVSNVLQDLKKANETFTSVSTRYRISPTTVAHIFDAFVSVPRKRLPKFLTVDEVYAFRNNKSNYVCVFVDSLTKDTIDILPSRKQKDLFAYFEMIPMEERETVQIVSMDLWATYRNVVNKVFPNSCCSADKFHILQELHRCIDTIRLASMNKVKPNKKIKKSQMNPQELYQYTEKENQYYLLKKFHWLLYKNQDTLIEKNEYGEPMNMMDPNFPKRYNRKLKKYLNLYDIESMILEINADLKTAIFLKSRVTQFYKACTYDNAMKEIEKLIIAFSDSEIPVLISFANTMRRWRKEIINSFIIIDKKTNTKATNAIAENRNKVIKQLKFNSNGYQNWDRFRNRVMFVTNSDATYRLNPIKEDQKW
jgi:transposase